MKILTDNWEGNKNQSDSFDTKDFNQVKNAFLKLDQKKHTQLILEGEESYLLIGGGNGKYIVTLTIGEDEEFFNLLNPFENETETETDLVTGGQLGTFPLKMIVNDEIATEAIHYYFANQTKNPRQLWEED